MARKPPYPVTAAVYAENFPGQREERGQFLTHFYADSPGVKTSPSKNYYEPGERRGYNEALGEGGVADKIDQFFEEVAEEGGVFFLMFLPQLQQREEAAAEEAEARRQEKEERVRRTHQRRQPPW